MKEKKIVVWGAGKYLSAALKRIDPNVSIFALCDSDEKKWGKCYTDKKIICISPEELFEYQDCYVIISIKSLSVIKDISSLLELRGIPYCHINDMIIDYQSKWEMKEIEKYEKEFKDVVEPGEIDKLCFFASISVPVEICNLQCRYCYISQHKQMIPQVSVLHSPEFIRRALSRKRLGGTALLNFCGVGETLLCKELIPIVTELLKEGHYVSIITNALMSKQIQNLVNLDEQLSKRLFFKCSFHYLQLKKKNLLDVFANNIKLIQKSCASYSIELVPDDETAEYIDEIKEFSITRFGALPHLTVARNEGERGIPLLTIYNDQEYMDKWRDFKSEMFDFKLNNKSKIPYYCLAGSKSALFSLDDGETTPCPYNKNIGNIFEDISKLWEGKPVGMDCCSPWCINGHAYLTLGLVKEIDELTYFDLRDRKTISGDHWVKPAMASFFKQRICDNLFD